MKRNATLSRGFALLLAMCLLMSSCVFPVMAGDGTVHIRSLEDWKQLAKDCTLDTWSQGVTVVLECDLVLTGSEIIPTFGGIFDGNGHSVTGLNLTAEGSHEGLFRYLQSGAVVKNLTVTGSVTPAGTCSAIGGIVGTNHGTVTQCTFRGTVESSAGVGGIAGVNEADGQILNCTVSGSIGGEHYTGGIAGENYGSIVLCENQSQVNTHETAVSPELDNVNWSRLNDMENMPVCTDSGGIAGYSKGIIQNCTNRGAVGYPHTGYNVGGIVGRQAGYVDGCTNTGTVQGRKEVGGIVGQMEPYTLLQFRQDSMNRLLTAMETLSSLMGTTLEHTRTAGTDLSGQLSALSETADDARGNLSEMLSSAGDWADGTIDTVNDLSARIARVLELSGPVLSDLSDASAAFSEAVRLIRDAMAAMDAVTDPNSPTYQQIKTALEALETVSDELHQLMEQITGQIDAIKGALGDDSAVKTGMETLKTMLKQLAEKLREASDRADDLSTALDGLTGLSQEEQTGVDTAIAVLSETHSDLTTMASAMDSCAEAVETCFDPDSGEDPFRKALQEISEALGHVTAAGEALHTALHNLAEASGPIASALSVASDQVQAALTQLADSAGSLSSGLENLRKLAAEQAAADPLELPKLDSSFQEQQDTLNTNLDSLSQQLSSLKETAGDSVGTLAADLEKINHQFAVITGILRDVVSEEDDSSEQVVDVSGEDSEAVTMGKVIRCKNRGAVSGDINVGGLTGAMAIEFDFDPEDDIAREGSTSAKFQFLTRSVLRDSVNYGNVTARKNCVGGAVGWMDLGLVDRCENYGSVTSTAGGYTGGIAGQSEAVIQNCWVKCNISGLRYLGGIAGSGTDISGCRVFASIDESAPYTGSIAGEAVGTLSLNYFVSDTLGGVDGISYAGKAQAMTYDELMALEGVPDELKAFTLTFLADGKVVTSRVFRYGDSLTADRLPEVPEKAGFYGVWEDFDMDRLVFDMEIEAVYTPWTTTLEAGGGTLLAEGSFTPETILIADSSDVQLPEDAGEAAQAWSVRLSDPDQQFTGLRIRQPEGIRHPRVWIMTDGVWTEADCSADGSYVYIPCAANAVQVCIGESGSNLLLYAAAGGGAIVLLAAILLIRRSKQQT